MTPSYLSLSHTQGLMGVPNIQYYHGNAFVPSKYSFMGCWECVSVLEVRGQLWESVLTSTCELQGPTSVPLAWQQAPTI